MQPLETTLQQERYRIIHLLKNDEKGVVYQAYDNALKTNVVLKEIPKSDQKPTAESDVRILTEIKHESISSAHNYFSEANRNYLVMELVDGDSVFETITKTQKPFSFLETLQWADQLLDALHYLHTHKPSIIHRHITPQNVMPLPKGKVKLLFAGDDSALSEILGGKTNAFSGVDLETINLSYVPLELLWENLDPASRKVILNSYDEAAVANLEKPIDVRSDIYAVGALFYYMLTGQHPVDALTRSISVLESDSDSLPAPHLLNASIPLEVSNVVMRSVEIKRENRFSSAVIMRQILRTAFVKTNAAEKTVEKPLAVNPPLKETKPAEQTNFEKELLSIEENRLKLEAEQKLLEQERILIQQKKLEFEAAQKEAESAQEKVRQAETKRLQAEQRAAEAEKKLLEKQKHFDADDLFELDILETNFQESSPVKSAGEQIERQKANNFQTEAEPISEEKISLSTDEIITPQILSSEIESLPEQELFATTTTSATASKNNSFRYVAAFVVLLIFGGAGWGVWRVASSKSSVQNEPALNQMSISNEPAVSNASTESSSSAQTPEATASPYTEKSSETAQEPETPTSSVKTTEVINNQPAPRNKPVPAQIKKATAPPPKPAGTPKKAVTVDDIISDN